MVQPGDARNPAQGMSRLLGGAPPLTPHIFACGSQLTPRWTRDGFHGYAPGMPGHLVATYYDRDQDCAWTHEGSRLAGRLRRGAITLIPDGRDGDWTLRGRVEVSHVYLTPERMDRCAEEAQITSSFELRNRVGFEDPIAARLLQVLTLREATGDPASQLFVDRAIDLLCLQLIAGHSSLGGLPQAAPRRGLAGWQVNRVTRHMKDNLDQPVRLDDVAGLVGLSRFHFCTAFRLATGATPHAWLTGERMRRACELLREPGLPIAQIALEVGYASASAFSAAFHRWIGATPTAYRQGF